MSRPGLTRSSAAGQNEPRRTDRRQEETMGSGIVRRELLVGAAGLAAGALAAPHIARAARATVIRFGLDLASDHPTTVNAMAAAKKIKDASSGAVEVQVFPSSQLGDDNHMLANIRSGAIQMMAIGDNIL